ncbi:phage minor head protein [Spongiactinospora sp. TRM90649]|uniref:phage minor head protein n=1 Tax=Spongiactinospora sp. TRM90649 TaxID=3031114 RepID=UPI0023F94D81|nr:phage minor head protein [Spongiactinospora sp. TRM90649]MDF5758602.1 phage minor head protein [Spongiactinospora sp. TRM90649]
MPVTADTLALVAAARAAVDDILDATTRTLTGAWVTAWDGLALDLLLALDELLATLAGGGWPSRARIARAARLQEALEAAARALEELTARVRSETATGARGAVQTGLSAQPGIIASQMPPGLNRAALLSQLTRWSERDLAAIVARTTERITSLTRPLSADAEAAMRRELVRGVAVGANPVDAARAMLARLEGAFNGGLTRAVTIARTEMLDAHRQAAQAGQDANASVLSGWIWSAAMARTTCPACWAMHGTVHRLEEPGPQGHPQCRCARTPAVRPWRELGIDMDDPPSVIPDAQATFRSMSRDDQLAVMGPGRLATLDRGDIAWADLAQRRDNPDWRPSYVPTPVGQLTR